MSVHKSEHYQSKHTTQTRPLRVFRPTRAELYPTPSTSSTQSHAPLRWSSRASRKTRYPSSSVHLTHRMDNEAATQGAPVSPRIRHPHRRMKVHLAWDLSFWVAVVFTLGSTAWVVNGFYLFLPLVMDVADHAVTAAWWAFVGGTLFEFGAYLMLLEALNSGHEELFGPELWGAMDRRYEAQAQAEEKKAFGADRKGLGSRRWKWIGLGDWRELGFTASFVQMFAATIFWVSTITGLPGVIPGFPETASTAIVDVFFWTPQVIGGWGFIIASLLLMLEVQKRWYAPNLRSLGWHIGLWNLIGAIGFMLCGALGYGALASTKVNYQSVLATFWGSFAFLIGSVIQLWEALWREDGAQD